MSDYTSTIATAIEIRDQAIRAGLTCPHAIAALILGETVHVALVMRVETSLERIHQILIDQAYRS